MKQEKQTIHDTLIDLTSEQIDILREAQRNITNAPSSLIGLADKIYEGLRMIAVFTNDKRNHLKKPKK